MASGKHFNPRAVPFDDPRRSYGPRRRYRGCMVAAHGEPRSENESAKAGGNSPRHNKRRGRKHTRLAHLYWERSGKRSGLPNGWFRGWR